MERAAVSLFRRLRKLCNRFDNDVRLRTLLCSWPAQHHDENWTTSQSFVNDFIRHTLNGGAQLFFPNLPSGAPTLSAQLRRVYEEQPLCSTSLQNAFECHRELQRIVHICAGWDPPLTLPPGLIEKASLLMARGALSPSPTQTLQASHTLPPILHLDQVLEDYTTQWSKPFQKSGSSTTPLSYAAKSWLTAAQPLQNSGTKDGSSGPPVFQQRVQLLVAHPQTRSLERYKVVLLAYVSPSCEEAVGFMLNAALCDEKNCNGQNTIWHNGRRVSWATPRSFPKSLTHPIFTEFLADHLLLAGGPHLSGCDVSEEGSLYILHRTPNVKGAVRLSATLWLDGDKDVLLQHLRDGTASPDDILLCVGFVGWGKGHLQDEIRDGKWLLTESMSTEDVHPVDDVVFALGRHVVEGCCPQSSKPLAEGVKSSRLEFPWHARGQYVAHGLSPSPTPLDDGMTTNEVCSSDVTEVTAVERGTNRPPMRPDSVREVDWLEPVEDVVDDAGIDDEGIATIIQTDALPFGESQPSPGVVRTEERTWEAFTAGSANSAQLSRWGRKVFLQACSSYHQSLEEQAALVQHASAVGLNVDESIMLPFVESWMWAYYLLGEPYSVIASSQLLPLKSDEFESWSDAAEQTGRSQDDAVKGHGEGTWSE